MQLIDLYAAVTQHMTPSAMAGADPLIDSLYGQLETQADEGAQPACSTGSGLTPAQRSALAAVDEAAVPLWLAALVAAAACAASALWPWGSA